MPNFSNFAIIDYPEGETFILNKIVHSQFAKMTERNLDIIVYGATGFTGKEVAKFLHQKYASNSGRDGLSWAISGNF